MQLFECRVVYSGKCLRFATEFWRYSDVVPSILLLFCVGIQTCRVMAVFQVKRLVISSCFGHDMRSRSLNIRMGVSVNLVPRVFLAAASKEPCWEPWVRGWVSVWVNLLYGSTLDQMSVWVCNCILFCTCSLWVLWLLVYTWRVQWR